MSIYITWWEIALLIIAIALVFATIYLVRFLKEMIQTLTKVNSLLSENTHSLNGIL